MSHKQAVLFIVAILMLAVTASFVLAVEGTPDERPATPDDVDPDGLEGLQAPSGGRYLEVLFKSSPQSQFLLRCFLQYARVIGF